MRAKRLKEKICSSERKINQLQDRLDVLDLSDDEDTSLVLSNLFIKGVESLDEKYRSRYPVPFLDLMYEQLQACESDHHLLFSLLMESKSPTTYTTLRDNGFLKLPNERQLRRYTTDRIKTKRNVFNRVGQTKLISEMKDSFRSSGLFGKANCGGLIFDEIKLQDGLVFSRKNGELIGYLDISDLEQFVREQDVEHYVPGLATHALQFLFQSLGSSWSYLCAFFLTNNATSQQIYEWFWEGVGLLEDYGFDPIFGLADGAHVNRSFFKFHFRNSSHQQNDDEP
eukprot:Lithocolla_globosa_v1_NODE_2441_length_2005_cov_2.974359.p1 type:complete len:283 gc:universal NODE_2441_length_2005_cov_2.974359:478-1326(+)